MWWIVGLLVLVVILLFQIAQRLRPVSAYFAKRDDEERDKNSPVPAKRWRDWY